MFGRYFSLLTSVVASVAFALSPGTAVAQHHGGGGHAGGGHGGGHAGGGHAGGGHGGGGRAGFAGGGHAGFAGGGRAGFANGVSRGGAWHGGYGGYGGYGYGRHGYGGWGYPGYYGGGLGLSLGAPWYGGYGYSPWSYGAGGAYDDTYPDYSDTMNYFYGSAPAYSTMPYTDRAAPSAGYSVYVPSAVVPGTYAAPAPAQDSAARVRVVVPADAQVWFSDSPTKQTGTVREFESPSLTPGREYTYEIRARWHEGDREVTRTRHVEVSANAAVTVDFTRASPDEKTATGAPGR